VKSHINTKLTGHNHSCRRSPLLTRKMTGNRGRSRREMEPEGLIYRSEPRSLWMRELRASPFQFNIGEERTELKRTEEWRLRNEHSGAGIWRSDRGRMPMHVRSPRRSRLTTGLSYSSFDAPERKVDRSLLSPYWHVGPGKLRSCKPKGNG